MKFTIELHDRPVPYQNNIRHGSRGFSYKTKRLKNYQELIAFYAKKQNIELFEADYDNPFMLLLNFKLKNKTHGDLDNLAKSVVDGLEGVLFNNDKFCNKMVLSYEYSDEWAIDVTMEKNIKKVLTLF